MVSVQPRYLTVDEFERLPDPDAGKLELDAGRVIQQMPVNSDHGELQLAIGGPLRAFVQSRRLGKVWVETGFYLGPDPETGRDTARAPDVAFMAADRVPPREERVRGVVHVAPDLAVEVLSPHDRPTDVLRKARQYFAAGVQRVWLVDPEERSISVIRPGFDVTEYRVGDTLTSEDAALPEPGFALPLDGLFPED